MSDRVRIPADVDREDVLLAGLTARQLLLLGAGGLILAAVWTAIRGVVPLGVFAALAAPVGLFAVAVALSRPDGMTGDRFALAAIRHARSPHRLVPAPHGVPPMPKWAEASTPPAAMPFPVAGVRGNGIIDLGRDGLALLFSASSLNFGLRSPEEQEALVVAFGQWLNSLDAPVQVVVRAEPVDVAAAVASLRERAVTLADPALARAALDHASYLEELASGRDVLRRSVLVVLRQPPVEGAEELLWRRADDARRGLAAAGVTVAPLPADEAVAALAAAVDPDAPPRPRGLALPGETVGRRR